MLTLDLDIAILSVRPSVSVRLSRSDIVSKWLNVSSYFLQRMVAIVREFERYEF